MEVDSRWVQEAITEFLGLSEQYNIVSMEEIRNNVWTTEVEKASTLDFVELEEAKQGKLYRTAGVLNCMCSKDLLDPGDYIIHITYITW